MNLLWDPSPPSPFPPHSPSSALPLAPDVDPPSFASPTAFPDSPFFAFSSPLTPSPLSPSHPPGVQTVDAAHDEEAFSGFLVPSSPLALPCSTASASLTATLSASPTPSTSSSSEEVTRWSAAEWSQGSARPGLREQRALRRKQQHQLLDVKRRQREATALQRLHQLTQLQLAHDPVATADDCASSGGVEVTVAVAIVEGSRRRGRGNVGAVAEGERPAKVAVLEDAVQQMERLAQLFDNASVASRLKDRHIHALQAQLQLLTEASTSSHTHTRSLPGPDGTQAPAFPSLSPSTFSFLSRLDCSTVLSSFVRPLISLLLVSMPDYLVVDVNAQHATDTGWSAASITNKMIAWSLSKDASKSDVSPLIKKEERQEESGAVRLRRVKQYPGSGQLLRGLLHGSRQKVDMHFRFYRPDGQLWETPCTCWLAAEEPRRVGDGRALCGPPGFVIIAAASQEAVRVDDWATEAVAVATPG